MFCPFIIGGHPTYCGAGQTSHAPVDKETRQNCMNRIAENYRDCWRYRRTVWSGLTPDTLMTQKFKEEK